MPKTRQDIQTILNRITFTPFGLVPYRFRLLKKGDGFLVQIEYQDFDSDKLNGLPPTGKEEKEYRQRGRKFYVSPYSTETEIVETVWLACTRSMMHVAGEWFTYQHPSDALRKPRRIYSPHFSVYSRVFVSKNFLFDKRPKQEKIKEKK